MDIDLVMLMERYHVEMNLSETPDSDEFVCFDAKMRKMTNVPAAAESQLKATGQEDPHNMAFHNASQMVGRTFTFQLKLTDFNFSASISLSRSHAYLIPTITDHFLIL